MNALARTSRVCLIGLALAAWGAALASAAPLSVDPALRQMVEEDWARQERRAGRAPDAPEALEAALARARALRDHLRAEGRPAGPEAAWNEIEQEARAAAGREAADRLTAYHRLRWWTRARALEHPSLAGRPLVFMKRNRYVCQMLHEYMGYFHDYGNVPPGGGVFVLEEPGRSLRIRDLIQGRLAPGNFATLALSHDARTVYFAFAERAEKKPDFYSAERRSFHIHAVSADGASLRQLTRGTEDDFDPCPLPDGGLAFMSSRRGGFARCNNAWEPTVTYTLHRMESDGSGLRTLSAHETAEWHPWVLNDGRVAYIRWDYVDRSAANFHGIWTSNPDGSAAAALFGNYTMRINACYQPRAIPGSHKLLFVAGAHHADVGGSLVLLDPRLARLDATTGEDILDSIERLTPEIRFPEADGWPKSYFHSPWPLSEASCLVAFSFEKLPGMSSGESRNTPTGLYYFDRFGNLELLYADPAIACMYPIPLAPRPRPPVVASNLDPALGREGEFLLSDVTRSLMPMPAGRKITTLRVFQLLPKGETHTVNDPRIGHANAENARMLLGTVPVEPDGSAYFRAPAGKPLYFQAVDERGHAVQSMRSVAYLQPGERRGCVGCHEPPASAAASRPTLAMRRPASRIEPGPEGSLPFSFPLLVQPVLDRHCVRCHDGQEGPGKGKTVLTAAADKNFSRAYQALKPYLRWYEWGSASISQIATQPGRIGADESPLTRILDDATHRPALQWTDAERRRIALWLDANVPFYGTYNKEEQLAQRSGAAIAPPAMQ